MLHFSGQLQFVSGFIFVVCLLLTILAVTLFLPTFILCPSSLSPLQNLSFASIFFFVHFVSYLLLLRSTDPSLLSHHLVSTKRSLLNILYMIGLEEKARNSKVLCTCEQISGGKVRVLLLSILIEIAPLTFEHLVLRFEENIILFNKP